MKLLWVKPTPLPPVPSKSAAPKISSSEKLVIAAPLEASALVPVAKAVISRGVERSAPEYSWAVMDLRPLKIPEKVAVTLKAVPPTIFLAYHISWLQDASTPDPTVGPTAFAYVLPAVSVILLTLCVLELYQTQTTIRLELPTGFVKLAVVTELLLKSSDLSASWTNVTAALASPI